ncbi:MAG TPA: hypothetical protein VK615_00365 [Candidatus Binatia bacterium]|nr:hypothetical protein [Candidatus Binatia bacterium]
MSAGRKAGFFTLGVPTDCYHLPHPSLGLPVILLIRRVLLRAFELLREQNFQIAEASEDEITAALRSTIENKLRQSGEVRGFSKRTFEFGTRQGQWANYCGACLTKTPDLFFKLRDDESMRGAVLSEFDGLFIEAKPVDSTHAAGGRYCDDGLTRFVRGDYAWAMQEGIMLAYARDGRTIATHLLPAMTENVRSVSLATAQFPERCSAPAAASCDAAEAVHTSRHRRAFEWPDGKGNATDITIYHLWYQCD